MPNILLTGSSGFLGSRILQKSLFKDHIQDVSLRKTPISDIDFTGLTTIIHCAGIAHRMEKIDDSLYFTVNRDLTLELSQKAKKEGVKQFIFLSTIKVYGKDFSDEPITLDTPCTPNDPYGQSKWEAEEGLRELEDEHFKVVITRPPLIYGPGAKGNLLKLMQAIRGGGPLPLGDIHNRRSMIFVDNLIALIDLIIKKEVSITITPSDEPAISTTYLVKQLAKTLNPEKKLIRIPTFLRPMIRLLKPTFYHRLFGSLEVAPHPELEKWGYEQPYSVEEGLKVMTEAFLNQRNLANEEN